MFEKCSTYLLSILFLAFSFNSCSNFKIDDKNPEGKVLVINEDTLGVFLPFFSKEVSVSDKITEIEEGIFKWKRTFKFKGNSLPKEIRLLMDFKAYYKSNYSMIPSVSYNGNNWKNSVEPTGFIAKDGSPRSFAYHRCSVAGATYSEDKNWTVSLFGKSEYLENGFSCSLIPESDATIHRLIWPEEEQPSVYISKIKPNTYLQGYARSFNWDPGKSFTATAYLIIEKKTNQDVGYQKMLDFAWKINHRQVQPWFSPDELWEMGIEFVKKQLWSENKSMFQVGIRFDGEKGYIQAGGFQLGWAGANGSVCVTLIHDYLKNANNSSLEMAIRCLDAWAAKQFENGLIDVASEVGWLNIQDMANQAQGAEAFFEAYTLLKKNKTDKPEYKETALKLCDFMVTNQKSSGLFGKAWSNDGTCVEPDGSIGSFMVRPLVIAYEVSGNVVYLESAIKGYDFYYNEFMCQGFATAGAIDIYTIDKEGAVGLLEGAIKLYEQTQDPDYLHKAKQAAYYLSTWQYHHSVLFPEHTPLAKMNYNTFGGTSVATAHACLDPYALKYFIDLIKLSNYLDEPVWKQRAIAIWNNATIGISNGSLTTMDLPPIPVGAQSETYFQTNWGTIVKNRFKINSINELEPMGFLSNWFVIWPTAYRLEILRNMTDWEIFY